MTLHARRSVTRLLAVLTVLMLVAAACGGDDDEETGATAGDATAGDATAGDAGAGDAGEPQAGGTMTYLFSGAVRSLDPITIRNVSASSDSAQAMPIYDVLFYTDMATGEIVPRIGESIESDDEVHWTLKLKPDVMFSDGTPLDAEAVKFNWERANDDTSELKALAATITEMEVVDPTTLEITLNAPNGQFKGAVATTLTFIGSPTAIKEKGDAFGDEPVGAGPFVLDSFQRGSQLVYKKNPNYWDSPRPYLDELVMREIPDDQQLVSTLQSGADDGGNPTPSAAAIELGKSDGFQLLDSIHNGGTIIGFNMTKPPFDDLRLRKAWTMAIDPQALTEAVGEGVMLPAETLFSEDGAWDPGPDLYDYDVEGAKALVEDYANVHDGLPVKASLGTFQGDQAQYEYMQAQLKEIGIEIAIEPADSTAAGQKVFTKNFQAHYWGTPFVDPDPALLQYFGTGSTQNFWGWQNETANEALEAARAARDIDERGKHYATFIEELQKDVPVFYYARFRTLQILKDRVHGMVLATDAPLWHGVWLEQ